MRDVKGAKESSIAHFVHGLFLLSAVFFLLTFLLMLIKRPSTHQPLSQQKAQVNDATLTKNYTAHYPVFGRPTVDTTIRNYIEQKVRGFEQKIARKKDIRHRLTAHFKVVHAGLRTASVIFYTTERIIGRPDVLTTERFTFDL